MAILKSGDGKELIVSCSFREYINGVDGGNE